MAKFDMKSLLNAQSKKSVDITPLPGSETWAVIHIPLEKITVSPDNKYGIRDIEELAANIESMGLMNNLVVKEMSSGGLYELISGERRYRACKMLLDGGDTRFSTVPCKVEAKEPKAISELKLIYANAMARELTDYEKTYQAGRIKELLQELKADGYPFKGRMRNIVAEMLGVSPAQMGRMESIGKNLSREFAGAFKSGGIGITTAYKLSTLPQEEQTQAFADYESSGGASIKRTVQKREPAKSMEPTKPIAVPAPPDQADYETTVRGLYAASKEVLEWQDSRAKEIAHTCCTAAALLEERSDLK